MGPSVNITNQGYLGNLNNSVTAQQTDGNPTVTATNPDNKIPTTGKRNIVIRAFKFIADRIVTAVKFVWNKLFSSKSETDKKQQPQAMDDSKNSLFTGDTNQDDFPLNQNPTIYEHPDNNLVLVGRMPVTNTEPKTAEDASIEQKTLENSTPSNETPKADENHSDHQSLEEQPQIGDTEPKPAENNTHINDLDSFEVVRDNIELPDPVDTYTYNRAHNKQQLIHQGFELVTSKLSDTYDAAKGNLSSMAVTAYGSVTPYFQAIQRDIFDGKQLKEDMGSYISNFIEATDRNDDAPNDCVKEMIKFTDNELKKLLCDQIDIHYKDLKTVDKLVKIYAMLNYTTEKLNTNTDSNSKSKANLIQLNKKLDNIYKSCFIDLMSYLHENEFVKTKKEAADALNTYLGKIFDKYTPIEKNWDSPIAA